MKRTTYLGILLAALAVGCGASSQQESDSPSPNTPPASSGGGGAGANGAITWCTTTLPRTGTIAGQSLDYPAEPDTTWFNKSLEEVGLDAIDEAVMKEAGLSRDDKADVERFKYFAHGFDFRWILRDPATEENWFGKSDFGVYLFDVADTSTAPGTPVAVFDASAVREARLSGDRTKLASAIRATVDAMKADPRPKAIVAFAPNRVPESSVERAFINLFARDVHFATTGSVTLSNLHDGKGTPIPSVVYPLRGVRSLDVTVQGQMAGAPFAASGNCLDLRISG